MLLDYESEILADLVKEDGLLVTAKALGVHRVVRQLIKVYSSPEALVLVINATQPEVSAMIEDLALEDGVKVMPKIITNECDAKERKDLYTGGGVLFVTSRILVVDMLTKRVPTDLISGFLVTNAHRVTDTTSEAFILRLYRETNKIGFIKAFSDNAEAFTKGFAQVQRVMRNLFISKLLLWPRFHASVAVCFDEHKPEVIELTVPLSDRMLEVQTSIIETMDMCLKELKRTNPGIELEEVTMENGLFANFDFLVRQQLDPVWHKTSQKTRSLVQDLKVLTKLLTYLPDYDCVTFYNYLETLRTSSSAFSQSSNWLMLDSAHAMFEGAKARVYNVVEKTTEPPAKKRRKVEEGNVFEQEEAREAANLERAKESTEVLEKEVEPVLEVNPKWELLEEVIEEAEGDITGGGVDTCSGRILVLVNEERTVGQLTEYLTAGGKPMLQRLFSKHIAWRQKLKKLNTSVIQPAAEALQAEENAANVMSKRFGAPGPAPAPRGRQQSRRGRRKQIAAMSSDLDLVVFKPQSTKNPPATNEEPEESPPDTGKSSKESNNNDSVLASVNRKRQKGEDIPEPSLDNYTDFSLLEGEGVAVLNEEEFNECFGLVESPLVVIQSTRSTEGAWHMERLLETVKPSHIIMYDPDLAAIRQIEVHKAQRPGEPMRVYFLLYGSSVELQKYLTSIRKEKEAFERLIHEKSIMAVPTEQDGRLVSRTKTATDYWQIDTRKAGRVKLKDQKVVVDMREFRSILPSLLHMKGIDIEPVTLEVGDYILTPDICVERKSVVDLINSMNSGRLYNQAKAMTQYYKWPVLLIEFDENKSFSLHAKGEFSGDMSWNHMSSKLTLLTLTFPSLRIIWSPSPNATAEIFASLKANYSQPDAAKAAQIGAEGTETQESFYSHGAESLLQRFPGINPQNIKYVLNRVENIYELTLLTLPKMQDLVGPSNGKLLYDFINANKK